MAPRPALTDNAITALGSRPDIVVRSPGRVNLIGDHTDYNDGFVMPFAIDREVRMAVRRRQDRELHARSLQMDQTVTFHLDEIAHGGPTWGEYLKGVAHVLVYEGPGLDMVIDSDIPVGAGLSSSAALELGLARALTAMAESDWDPVAAALACQRAENEWVGTECGIMDQLVVATASAGNAMLIDCRTLEVVPVVIPHGVVAVVFDTGMRRSLAESGYNQRRKECGRAAAAYGVSALRDLTPEQLTVPPEDLDETGQRRARHVVTENQRVLAMADALAEGQLSDVRRLMTESHSSLEKDFEVTTHELDLITQLSLDQRGCVGARMTDAGFGGCTVALFEENHTKAAKENVTKDYRAATGITSGAFECNPASGTSVVDEF